MLRLIRRDRMLLAAGAAPLLAGVALRCGVPAAEEVLVRCTGTALSPYYGLFDILLASLTPAMFCFIAAMVMLEERDDHIDRYLFATAVGWIAALWRRIQRGCRFLDRKSDLENSKIPIDPDAASSCILCPCLNKRKHKEVLR